MSIQEMWKKELNILEQEYINYREERERSISGINENKKKKVVVKKSKLTIVD